MGDMDRHEDKLRCEHGLRHFCEECDPYMFSRWKEEQLERRVDRPITGVKLIATERERQIKQEGYSPQHDASHNTQELIAAAWCYLDDLRVGGRNIPWDEPPPEGWPWHREDWKPTPDDAIRQLVKAGALIAAEIDRRMDGT